MTRQRHVALGRSLAIGLSWTLLATGCFFRASPRVATTSLPASDSSVVVSPPVITAPTPATRIPRDAARFEIAVVDDSTARFKPREALWIRDGMTAYIVDPFNRDALVARAKIVSVWNETAVAVVTSQVTRVTTQHVVLMTPPPASWWNRQRFWVGAAIGVILGGGLGAAAAK